MEGKKQQKSKHVYQKICLERVVSEVNIEMEADKCEEEIKTASLALFSSRSFM
jgi:hypothetical protein